MRYRRKVVWESEVQEIEVKKNGNYILVYIWLARKIFEEKGEVIES